jgi:histidinol-phosphate aminotransferase
MYNIYAKMSDSKGVPVQLGENFILDREAMLATADTEKASLMIICNPNNPTGTLTPFEDIEYILARAKCPVVIDEAYYEFYGGHSAVELLAKYPQLIVARTFSKAYGLASARVGYMLASAEIVQMVEKGFTPYHVSALSLATAEIVYKNKDKFQPIIKQAVSERQRIASELTSIGGIEVYPSATNFVLFKIGDVNGLNAYLADRNIGVRAFCTVCGLEGCMRVSVGTPEENTAFINAVKHFKRGE